MQTRTSCVGFVGVSTAPGKWRITPMPMNTLLGGGEGFEKWQVDSRWCPVAVVAGSLVWGWTEEPLT